MLKKNVATILDALFEARKEVAVNKMPKEERKRNGVLGHAPRKALGVKNAINTGAGKPKSPKKTVKAAKPAVPAAVAEPAADAESAAVAKPVSILRSPRSTSTTPPSSPIACSPTLTQTELASRIATLAARIEVGRAEMRTVKDRLKELERDLGFPRNTAAEDGRPAEDGRAAEDARPAPSRFGE